MAATADTTATVTSTPIPTITATITTTATGTTTPTATAGTTMGEPRALAALLPSLPEAETGALLRLMTWLSPAFPVGSFSYSHGLEWAIEDGTVGDAAALEAWIADVLRHGGGRSDAILLAHTWRAATAGDTAALAHIAELAAALQPSRERQLETTAQGRAFLDAVAAAWPAPALPILAEAVRTAPAIALPVAIGVAAAAHRLPLADTLAAALNGFAANLVSAGVRAIPIGHTDGQRVIAALVPVVGAVAREAATAPLDAIGGASLRADIASMKHETQYTRLFRS